MTCDFCTKEAELTCELCGANTCEDCVCDCMIYGYSISEGEF